MIKKNVIEENTKENNIYEFGIIQKIKHINKFTLIEK